MKINLLARTTALLLAVVAIGATGGPSVAAPTRAPQSTIEQSVRKSPLTWICSDEPEIIIEEQATAASVPCEEETPPPVINNSETDRITNRLREVNDLCETVVPGYRIDCIQDQYRLLARSMSDGEQSREIKKILNDAADKLDRIAKSAADNSAPKVRPKVDVGRFGRSASRPLTPVRPEALAQANQAALAVMDEVSTLLLRSAESSRSQNLYYTQIADAVDSNKVLLRSS